MDFDLETHLASLPEAKRERLREQMKHSVSFYGPKGEHHPYPGELENLLEVLMHRDRYMVDSNSDWTGEASKAENQTMAFIVGQTVTDEAENLKAVLFGRKVDISNQNLLEFGMEMLNDVHVLTIHRFDRQFSLIFDEEGLREESRPRAKRTDAAFLESEAEHAESVHSLKARIHEILPKLEILDVMPDHINESNKAHLIQQIRSNAPRCFLDWDWAAEVASFCYAALLSEQDDVGNKTRKEFFDPNNRNVFGDTRLIQNALWLKARILSNDRAVKRMADYVGMTEITVTGAA